MNEAQLLLAQMSNDNLEILILRLGRYAKKESRRLKWRTGNSNELPKGETADSIVSKAFVLVLSNERKWNPQSDPDLAKYLMDVIDSLLSHLVNSKDNTLFRIPPEAGSEDEAAWHGATRQHERKYEQSADWMNRTTPSPEQELIEKENAATAKQAMNLLEENIKNDAQLVAIVKAIREGYGKNGEISKQTGIDIKDVEKAKKRLDRKIANVSIQMKESNSNGFVSEKRSNNNGR